jgi:hypothetical protein
MVYIQQNEEIVARINTRQIRKSYNTDLNLPEWTNFKQVLLPRNGTLPH